MEWPAATPAAKFAGPLTMFAAALLVVLIALYWPWLSGSDSYFRSDICYYFEPQMSFIARQLMSGHLPFWNPYVYCGMSQLAVPSPGIFYWPTLLSLFLPFSKVLAWTLVAHQMLAAVGAYLLVREYRWGLPSALVAALVAGTSGYMFCVPNNYTLVASAAWLPVLLWAMQRLGRQATVDNAVSGALVAFATAGSIYAGRPEIFVPVLFISSFYALGRALVSGRAQGTWLDWRLLLSAASSMFAGVCLAAPVILPCAEWVRESPRSQGLDPRWVFLWSANWYDCLGMVLAQPLGDLTLLGAKYLGVAASRSHYLPFLASTYVGPVVITLALWGLGDRSWRYRGYALLTALGALVLALGSFTPIAPGLVAMAPMLGVFRYPVKLMIIVIFAVGLLAARGVRLMLDKGSSLWVVILPVALWLVALLVAVMMAASPELCYIVRPDVIGAGEIVTNTWLDAQQLLGQSLLKASVLGLSVSAIALLYRFGSVLALRSESLVSTLLLGCLAGSLLFGAARYMWRQAPADFFTRPNKLADLVSAKVKHENGMPGFAWRFLPGYFDPLTCPPWIKGQMGLPWQIVFYAYGRQKLLYNVCMDYGLAQAFGYEAAESGSFKTWFDEAIGMSSLSRYGRKKDYKSDAPLARFCRMTSTRVVLSQVFRGEAPPRPVQVLQDEHFKLVKEDQVNNLRVYECSGVAKRAAFARRVGFVHSFSQLKESLLDPCSQRAFDESAAIILLKDGTPEPVSSGLHDVAAASCRWLSDECDELRLATETTAPEVLVVTDQFYPGWQAEVDGKPTTMYRANMFARAVVVPAGIHTVSFNFRPNSFYIGLGLAVTVLSMLVLVTWLCFWRQGRSANAPRRDI